MKNQHGNDWEYHQRKAIENIKNQKMKNNLNR